VTRETTGQSFNRRVGRRELLAMGVASGAAALLPGVAHARPGTGANPAGIGYVLGSESGAGLGIGPSGLGFQPIVVAPASAIAPQTNLAGASLDLTTYGLFPALPGGGISTAALDANFASFVKRERGPFSFAAWTFTGGNPPRSSSRAAFTMPVDSTGALNFTVRVADAAGSRSRELALSLDARAAARLRTGFYLFGLQGTEFASEMAINPSGPADWSLLSLVLSVRRST
jgi:hypothetical protein